MGLNTFDSIFVVFCLIGGTLTIFSVLKRSTRWPNTLVKTLKHFISQFAHLRISDGQWHQTNWSEECHVAIDLIFLSLYVVV